MLKQKKKRKKIHQHKKPSSIKNIDFDKMVVSNNVSFGKKKKDLDISLATRMLCIFLPKMNAYIRDFDETNIKDDELLQKYNVIQESDKSETVLK